MSSGFNEQRRRPTTTVMTTAPDPPAPNEVKNLRRVLWVYAMKEYTKRDSEFGVGDGIESKKNQEPRGESGKLSRMLAGKRAINGTPTGRMTFLVINCFVIHTKTLAQGGRVSKRRHEIRTLAFIHLFHGRFRRQIDISVA